jgi:hypothetical protein
MTRASATALLLLVAAPFVGCHASTFDAGHYASKHAVGTWSSNHALFSGGFTPQEAAAWAAAPALLFLPTVVAVAVLAAGPTVATTREAIPTPLPASVVATAVKLLAFSGAADRRAVSTRTA